MVTSVFIPGTQDITEPLDIRREVFIDELGWPEQAERDGFDESALHLMVYVDEAPAATGRIWHDGGFRMGRLAVKKQFRGQQIGDLALRVLIYKAFSSGAETLIAIAPKCTIDLYKKFGFAETGTETTVAQTTLIELSVKKDDVVYPSACGR